MKIPKNLSFGILQKFAMVKRAEWAECVACITDFWRRSRIIAYEKLLKEEKSFLCVFQKETTLKNTKRHQPLPASQDVSFVIFSFNDIGWKNISVNSKPQYSGWDLCSGQYSFIAKIFTYKLLTASKKCKNFNWN